MFISPSIDVVLPALAEAKKAIAPIVKDKANDFFNAKYADLGSVLDAIEPALLAQGIIILQPTEFLPATGHQTVVTELIHIESGQFIGATWVLEPSKRDPQGFGSALTYARRYCLMSLLGIAPEDDDGNASAQRPAAQGARDFAAEAKAAGTLAQLKNIQQAANAAGEWVADSDVEKAVFARKAELEKAGKAPAASAPSGAE